MSEHRSAAEERSSKGSVVSLLTLQDHDVAIAGLKRRLASLPERQAAHDLNERRRNAETQIEVSTAELEKLAGLEAELEEALAVAEKRASSLDATMRAPGSATRDAQAIIQEIDRLRAQASSLEERGLGFLEERDAVLARQAQIQAELDAVAQEAPSVLASLRAAEGDAGKQLAAREAERAAAAASLKPDVLATYDRLRERLDGVAVARVAAGACTGCHLALSNADVEQFARLAPGDHATCEQCGRILVRE